MHDEISLKQTLTPKEVGFDDSEGFDDSAGDGFDEFDGYGDGFNEIDE